MVSKALVGSVNTVSVNPLELIVSLILSWNSKMVHPVDKLGQNLYWLDVNTLNL